MNKKEILELVEKDFLTLGNLERSMQYAIKSGKGRQYQFKILHAAFRRTCDIMLNRRKTIAKELGLKPLLLKNPME